ncbi:hypothetical protein WMF31_32365 [Sorangium sp. So ce1036]|uniref:hypothetical protein n=1 Tax=Sorangium sp. So ce1036 TaxID=3133328 RepID=UPI003F106268
MKCRLSSFIAAAIVAILSPLAGCTETPDDTGAGGAGGSGASVGSGGSGASGGSEGSGGSGGSGGPTGSTSAGTGGGGGAGGGSGSTGSGDEIPPTFETVKFVIENVTCFGAGCHNDEQNPLDLRVDGELHARLTSHISKNCGNIPIVNPGKPEESALIKILKGPCGVPPQDTPRMPPDCLNDGDSKCVPDNYMQALTQWIADGAQE